MNNLENTFNDIDIDIFIGSYNQHILENPLLNSKIPIWVEYLKTKKYYRDNGMQEDYFFNKRFGITSDDLLMIKKLINRVKRGKSLDRVIKSNVKGNYGINANSSSDYSEFNENEDYENGNMNNFELLDQVQDAMNKYYRKMKKSSQNRNWKQSENNRTWEIPDSVDGSPDRYYSEGLTSERPNIEYDVQGFAKSDLLNMNRTNIIQKIDKINNILDHNDLITNEFDTEYKTSVPNLSCKKKVQFTNEIDKIQNNGEDIGVQRFQQDQDAMTRLWQEQSIMNSRDLRRNTAIPNKNPFEHQFDYLDCNYNRVEDPRLIGQSSRLDNRSTFNRY